MERRVFSKMSVLPILFVALMLIVFCTSLSTGLAARELTTVERELRPELYKGPKTLSVDTMWHEDILGNGYEARSVNLGEAFDGPAVCTLVRKLSKTKSDRAVLYVHGFNDYFFQKEMGDLYADSGYNFYAVDLRRYGRSLRPWQYPFNVRKMDEYFEDIDSALRAVRLDGNRDVSLCGHSTGGLTVALFAAERGKDVGVERVVTNSPFLDWNFSAFYRKILIPTVKLWGALSPDTKIKQGHCDAYAESLLRCYHGEWEYNTDWKMVYSPPVTASWVRAISQAQSRLMKHGKNISVPVLVMHSDRGLDACGWSEACQWSDVVLNPEMIGKRGRKLGESPDVAVIDSGMHDLILSAPRVREAAYDTIFRFIRTR